MLSEDLLTARALLNALPLRLELEPPPDVGRQPGLRGDPGATSASVWDLLCSWATLPGLSVLVSPTGKRGKRIIDHC